ncbi:ATP-binding protein [Nocardia sp. NPDC004860]|uniref:sensor histidine kinase n=1 Tax=Nocardia sp. NPDC004860 TaxID=3154557 RepID=UPI0033AB3F03
MRSDAMSLQSWWTPFAIIIVFVPPLSLLAAAIRVNLRILRYAAEATAGGYLVAIATWPLAWTGPLLPDTPWMTIFPGLAALAVALVWRPVWSIGYLFIVITIAMLISQTRTPETNSPLALDFLFGFTFSLIYVAAVSMAVQTGRKLDETRAESEAAAATAAVMKTLKNQRDRFHDLIHGWIMVTVGAAAKNPNTEEMRHEALRALEKLDSVAAESSPGHFDIAAAARYLDAAVVEVDDTITRKIRTGDDDRAGRFDSDIVRTLAMVLAEAVRNSLRHAGARAARSVQIDIVPDRLDAVVKDSGVGFDPAADSDRFGLRSMRSLIHELPGGSIGIESSPGHGTTVRLAVDVPDTARATHTATPNSPDVRVLVGMNTKWAWIVAWAFILGLVGLAAIAIYHHAPAIAILPAAVAVLLLGGSSLALLKVEGDPLPWMPTLALTIAGPAASAIVMFTPPLSTYSHQVWPISAYTAVCTFMCVRGRTPFAWLGMTSAIAVAAAWSLRIGHGVGYGIGLTIVNYGPLAMSTLFAYTIRPAAREIYRLRDKSAREYAAAAATEAALEEKSSQLADLNEHARPVLERIANGEQLNPEDASYCKALESQLQATLYASNLVHPLVTPSADAARRRRVEVNLWDSHGIDNVDDDAVCDRLLRGVAAELDLAHSGHISVRIVPPDRDELATVVARTETMIRRVSFDRAGYPTITTGTRTA